MRCEMRKKQFKLVAFLIIFCLIVPLLGHFSDTLTAQAAEPSLNYTSTTVYMGTKLQLEPQNVDASKVKTTTWKANRSSIAKVDKTGLVTPVSVGTTTIKCTITYKDGKSVLLTCTVKVRNRVACTDAAFTNTKMDDGNAQKIYIGEKFTLKKKLTPSKTTDLQFWVSTDEDIATVTSSGVVTAKKEGFTIIELRLGENEESAMRADNKAVARLYLHVTKKPEPTPTPTATPLPTSTPVPTLPPQEKPQVASAAMVGSQELQINFASPVRKSSVISNGKLIPGTIIIGRDDGAADFGTLTPSLSSDLKRLTINCTGTFSGTYSVVVTDKVLTSNGTSFGQYAEVLKLKDTTGPSYVNTTVGYTGWSSSINFSEAIDISNLSIESVTGTSDVALSSYLRDTSNYTLSSDGKSLVVNLEGMTTDKSLMVIVSMRGIRDIAGNAMSTLLQRVYVRTDATSKAMATIVRVERVSKTELEVTFSEAIQWPGVAKYGSETVAGMVDSTDMKVVHYEIPYNYQGKTGMQLVEFSNWYNYNSSLKDTKQMFPVDFTLDTTLPQLVNAELVNGTYNGMNVSKLILTYNKEIANAAGSPLISIRVKTVSSEIATVQPAVYEAAIEGDVVTYMLVDNILLEGGDFMVSLPAGLVSDKLDNVSAARTISISKGGSSANELPGPVSVEQDMDRKSVVRVTFSNKLDLASAENVANYYVLQATGKRDMPVGVTVVSQSETSAVLELEFALGTFGGTSLNTYELVLQNIKGYNGTFGAMSEQHSLFQAVENTPPTAKSTKLQYSTIIMTMTEEVTGTVKVTAIDAAGRTIAGEGYGSGDMVYIVLNETPTMTSKTLRFNIVENNITDINGNKAALNTSSYYFAISE